MRKVTTPREQTRSIHDETATEAEDHFLCVTRNDSRHWDYPRRKFPRTDARIGGSADCEGRLTGSV
jgi:hypothetical protein